MPFETTTKYGAVRGYAEGGVIKFHAIPYAKPPVGALRFRLPQEPDPWDGVLDARERGVAPPQYASDLDLPMGPIGLPTGEDCLTLAVSTPSLDACLPVAVWFHGGANCYGGGDLPWYDGAGLARSANVVEVNLNFRLGPLGFLCVKGVQEENLSIEDQMLALRWIRDNIRSFGGDPNRITLFGQSAGGNAIAHILSRPDSEGLFHQVILQSASLGRGNHLLSDAFEVGDAVLRNLGIDPDGDGVLQKLQEASVDAILQAADTVPQELKAKHQGMYFKPVMDSWHTPEQTARQAAEMAAKRGIRVVTGFTKDETHAFSTARDPASLEALERGQHLRYELPGGLFAQTAADLGCDVWKYEFDWSAPDSIFDSCHCLELPFLFGNFQAWNAPFLAGADPAEMQRLKETLQSAWGTFFRGETPDAGFWPKYTSGERTIKFFDNETNPVGREPEYRI